MPLPDLTNAHTAAQSGAFEPQRGNNALLRIFGLTDDTPGAKGESVLTLSLQSFPLPNIIIEPVETFWVNEKRKVPGLVNFEDIEVVYKDFVDVGTAHIMKTWHEQVYNPVSGKIGLARNIKKTGIIELFAPDGTFSRYHSLSGIWPSNFNAGTIDMTSSEPVVITVTLSVDKIYSARTPGLANLISSVLS
jgi:hypothetical protein